MTAGGKPYVTLKLATSLDGKIALANGQSKWITGPESRAEVHRMRASHDAILTGVGTIIADDPELTARTDPPTEKQPDVIVLDRTGRMPMNARVFACVDRQVRLSAARDLAKVVEDYGRVMVEAGARVAASVLQAELIDRVEWFRAPVMLGGDGLGVIADLGLESLDKAPMFRRVGLVERGADIQESYERIR